MAISPRRIWLHALIALVASGVVGSQPASPAQPSLPEPSVVLDWQVTGAETDSVSHRPVTHARLVLTNTGKVALPAGWTLYFTQIADAATADPAYPVRRVTGSLFAVDPVAASAPLAPGQSLTIAINHPGEILRDDKGPTGPYLVTAGNAGQVIAIRHFVRTGPRRGMPGVPDSLFTDPAAVFRANAALALPAGSALAPSLPEPRQWHVAEDTGFAAALQAPALSAGLANEAPLARRLVPATTGAVALPFSVRIGEIAGETSPEAYRLTIDRKRGVAITGQSSAGVFYGLQTLDQILFAARQADGGLLLHDTEIADAPRFVWRGVMLDLARNFQSPDRVVAVMDLMARFKLNRLHLHLSDDEGWRLAIAGLPELTSVGGRRGHSANWQDRLPPAHGSGSDVADPHGSGFLSAVQYVALLRAAKQRHIVVIPEFDLPGHARAAIKAMAARAGRYHPDTGDGIRLDDPRDQSRYRSAQGFTDNVINPAMPGTDAFVLALVREVRRLHALAGVPLKVLHIGGDEVPAGAWEASPAVSDTMAREGTTGPAKPAMWHRFFDHTLLTLQSEGIAAMGWEELALVPGSTNGEVSTRYADHGPTIEIWNDFPGSEGLPVKLANAGFKVVAAPAHALYFDMAQSSDPAEPGHDWARILPLDAVWAFDPLAKGAAIPPLSESGRANLLGIEATLFAETVREPWRIDHMLMPRLLAMAERGWSRSPDWLDGADANRNDALKAAGWAAFVARLGDKTLPYVDARFPALAYRLPAPGAIRDKDRVSANYAWPGVTLRYSLSDKAPNAGSPVMNGPITAPGLVTVAAFTTSGRASPAVTIEAMK